MHHVYLVRLGFFEIYLTNEANQLKKKKKKKKKGINWKKILVVNKFENKKINVRFSSQDWVTEILRALRLKKEMIERFFFKRLLLKT